MSNVFPAKRTLQLSKMRPNIEWWNISKGTKTPLPCWEWKCMRFEGWDPVPRRLFGRWYIPPHSCDHPWMDLGRVGTVHKRLCIPSKGTIPSWRLLCQALSSEANATQVKSPVPCILKSSVQLRLQPIALLCIPFLDVSMSYGERRDNHAVWRKERRKLKLDWKWYRTCRTFLL